MEVEGLLLLEKAAEFEVFESKIAFSVIIGEELHINVNSFD